MILLKQISKEKIKILLAVILSLSFFGLFLLTSDITPKKDTASTNPVEVKYLKEEKIHEKVETNQKFETAQLEINNIKYEGQIKEGTSVYDFMLKLRNEGKIKFKEKYYIGMGKFIDELNGIKNNGEKNWIYYVNGEKAKIGISNYKIKPRDVVSWKYEKDIN